MPGVLNCADDIQTGVVNEGLRLSHGMTARLSRISPIENMLYKDWVIPAGVRMSFRSP